MKLDNYQIRYSPSDLINFLGCRHASFLDIQALTTDDIEKTKPTTMELLLQKKGLEHEYNYLKTLKNEGKSVVEIPTNFNSEERANLTLKAIESGSDVIFQAVLSTSPWIGYADFLIKCDTPSKLGTFSYEVLDTKLARTVNPNYIIQLCAYSDLLTNVQEIYPKNMHLFLGDQEKHSFQVADFFYYYKRTKVRFESYIKSMNSESYPEPCRACNFCKWRDRCNEQWLNDNHLSLVANIQRSQINKMRKAGINSVNDLSETQLNTNIPDLNNEVFQRLRSQATLQHHKLINGEDKYEILPTPPEKGFSRIPVPDNGDLFFDM